MLNWHVISEKDYRNLPTSEKTFDKLFYIINTNKIFCGLIRFSESVVIYQDEEPSTNTTGKIYISGNNLEGRIWENDAWTMIIEPVGDMPNDIKKNILNALQTPLDRMMKVGSGYTSEILISDATGDASPSGVMIGGSKINTPTDKMVATEKAIVDYVDKNTLKKDTITHSDNIPDNEDNASDDKVASEKSVVTSMSWKILME
jgi:hypothetical protein